MSKFINCSMAAAAVLFGCAALPVSAQDADCSAQDGATFVCGVTNVEQLIAIEGTRWAVGSSSDGGAVPQAPLYFFNLDTQIATPLDGATVKLAEDKEAYPGCPAAPDFTKMLSLGVDYKTYGDRNLLSVVNHRDGYSIQMFEMDNSGALPALTWLGCVMPPAPSFWPDALVALPDGGMVVTSLFDPTDANFAVPLRAGAPYGMLAEWHAAAGWTEIAPGALSGPNGVIMTPDAKTLYVADWGGQGVVKIDRASGATERVDTGFHVDNLVWSEDGSTIFAGGQNGSIDDGFACFGSNEVNCPNIAFSIVALDPQSLAVTPVFGPGVIGVMGAGTGVLQDGDHLWVTSFRSDRIARIAAPN